MLSVQRMSSRTPHQRFCVSRTAVLGVSYARRAFRLRRRVVPVIALLVCGLMADIRAEQKGAARPAPRRDAEVQTQCGAVLRVEMY